MKTPVLEPLFNKVAGLLDLMCFPLNIVKFLRTRILKNFCERLLLRGRDNVHQICKASGTRKQISCDCNKKQNLLQSPMDVSLCHHVKFFCFETFSPQNFCC